MQLPKVAAPMEFYLSYVHGKTTYIYTWRFHYAIKVHYMTCGLKPAGNKMIIQSLSRVQICFKYFQDLVGQIRLPPDFIPERVSISVQQNGKKTTGADFEWSL